MSFWYRHGQCFEPDLAYFEPYLAYFESMWYRRACFVPTSVFLLKLVISEVIADFHDIFFSFRCAEFRDLA